MNGKKVLFNIAIAATLTTAVIAIPAETEASGLSAGKVVFDVNGQLKVISADAYIMAYLGATPDVAKEISVNGAVAAPKAVYIGGKYISAEEYIMQYMFSNGSISQETVDKVADYNVAGAKELVGSSWVAVTDSSEVSKEFEIISID